MANYSYGGLLVNVTADTRAMSRSIQQAALSSGAQAAKSVSSTIGGALAGVGKTAAVGLGTGVGALTAFGVASFKTAARVDEMNATLEALAKANHLSYPAVQASVTAIRKQGIEAGVAQSTVAQFAQQHLDLAKSTDLSRLAQDAAVISGQNSSDVLQQLIHGISTQQTDVLRQAGVQIDANKAQADYAKQLHTTVAALTPAQKSQATLNAVLAQGKSIAGAYAAAMEKPGKVLRSFPRLFDDIKVSVGTGLVDAFGPLILGAYHFTKALDTTLAPGGALAPILKAVGEAATSLVAPLTGVVGHWTDWVKNLKPGQVTGIVNAIKGFAPEITAVATALGVFAGGKFTSQIPIVGQMLGNLGGPLGAVTAGVGALVATSPEARAQLGGLAKTVQGSLAPVLKTLAPVVAQVVQFLGPLLAGAIRLLAPIIVTLVTVLGKSLVPVIASLAPVFLRLAPLVVRLVAVLAGGLLKVIVALAPVLAQLAVSFSGALLQVIPLLIPVVEQLTPLIAALAGILAEVLVGALKALAPLLPLLPVVLRLLLDVLVPLIPLITVMANVLAELAPVLAPLVVAVLLIVGAMKVWAIVQTALTVAVNLYSAAMFLAGVATAAGLWPILAIVAGVAILVVAFKLAYDHFAWFRTAVSAVFAAVGAAFNWFLGIVKAVFGWVAANWPLLVGILTGPVGLAVVLIIGHFTQVRNFITATLAAIYHAILTAWNAVYAFVASIVGLIWSVIAAAWTHARDSVGQALGAIYHAVLSGFNTVLAFIRGVVAEIGRVVGTLVTTFLTIGSNAARSLWTGIKTALGNVGKWINDTIVTPIKRALEALAGIATTVGSNAMRGMLNGILGVMKGIAGWVKREIVDKLINAVKGFFHIPTGGGAPKGKGGKQVPQGGGGTAGSGAPTGGPLVDAGGDVLHGLLSRILVDGPIDIAKTVFGGAAEALGWMVVRGFAAIESLGEGALRALKGIPGVSAALAWLAGAAQAVGGLFGKVFGGIFGGGGGGAGGGNVGALLANATHFGGHRYVWGGPANARAGFDCSSFVNMLAMGAGLPIPGGFHQPGQHGPVTGNWLSFGGMKTVPWPGAPGDIYVNGHHMGIVTGPGKGFAARSTATGTGPQNVPRGAYTIRRWPGGGKGVGGGTSLAELLAAALADKMGLSYGGGGDASVISGGSTANLVTIARYMLSHGWSGAAAAGISGNVYQESKGDPLAFGTGGRGLIGWTPPSRLANSAFIPGNPSASLSRQLPLVSSFFRQNMGRYATLANQQSDPGRAALVIMNMGERPAGSSQSNPFYGGSGTSRGSLRVQVAKQIFARLKGTRGVRMAQGGVIGEYIAGVGESGTFYHLGERGAEVVSPLAGGAADLALRPARGVTVNVYPRAQQSETEVAAAVSRALAWAQAGGTP